LVFVPLFRAGATPVAALISQLLALVLLAIAVWSPQRMAIGAVEATVLVLLGVLPALYLLPLPPDVAAALPGRALYTTAVAYFPESNPSAPGSLAVHPGASAAAALSLIVPISVFLGVRLLKPKQIDLLIGLVIAIASFEALLGLLQYGISQGGGTPLVVAGAHRESAVGTYANRNHLAGLLEMVLPVTLALLFSALGRLKASAHATGSIKRTAVSLGSRGGPAAILYAAVALLLIVGVVFTRSRTGIVLVVVGIIASAAVFSRQVGPRGVLGPAGILVMLAIAAGIGLGLAPVLERFSVSALEGDARWQIFDAALLGARDLLPFGGGPGAFPFVFPSYQPLELGRFFVNRAHNDYLEWYFDLGVVGVMLVALVLVVYLGQWRRILSAFSTARSTVLQVGCGIGVLLLAMHELVDYNLTTPANQAVFAVLMSVFLYPPTALGADNTHRPGRRQRRTPDLVPKAAPQPIALTPPPDQIKNPFLSD
jgi:O-antigen ligase